MDSITTNKSAGKTMKLWKWTIELLLGFVVFMVLYGMAQGMGMLPGFLLKNVCFVGASAVILAAFMGWIRLFEKKWPLPLMAVRPLWNLSLGLGVGFAFFILVALSLMITGTYSPAYASPDWSLLLLYFTNFLLVACGEEVIFRGIIFRCLDERYGIWLALAVSSLLFGFAHIFQFNATLWSSIAIAIEAGLLLGAAYKYTGSLWLPIGIHWAWNFTQGNVFGFPVSGGSEDESIFKSVVEGPEWLTGGAFGPEASVITVVLGLLFSIFFIREYLKNK